MSLPSKVRLFSRNYEIVDVDPYARRETGLMGQAEYRDGRVLLDSELPEDLAIATLWHELTHLAQQELQSEVDEPQACWISHFVHDVLINNPSIAAWYMKNCDGAAKKR